MHGKTVVEGRCADCVLNMLQLSGRGPGRYGYCRLRDIVLEYPWAMVCERYQYWGDRPAPGKKRLLLEKPSCPLLDYSSQKPVHVSLKPDELRERHADEVDDDIKRNVGASQTAQDFKFAPPEKQFNLMKGFLAGHNPYNYVIAVNAMHHFPIEKFPEEKQKELYDKFLDLERKNLLSDNFGIVADKISYALGFSLARINRDLFTYLENRRLKKHKKDYEENMITLCRKFALNPEIKARRGVLSLLFGR